MTDEYEVAAYLVLGHVHDDLSARIRGAISRREWRAAATLLCDRACTVMMHRDLWPRGSREWERWDTWMVRDVNAASRLAKLADRRAA